MAMSSYSQYIPNCREEQIFLRPAMCRNAFGLWKFSLALHFASTYLQALASTSKMRLDATDLRYVTADEFRVLTAVSPVREPISEAGADKVQVEIGSKNHEVVPTQLIAEISAVRGGNVNKALGALAKRDLVARVQNAKCKSSRRRRWANECR